MRLSDCIMQGKTRMSGAARLRRGLAAPVLVILIAGSSGCGSIKPVRYYQLTHPPTTSVAGSQAPLDVAILVRLFQSAHIYREDRIVYGAESVKLGLYENDRWTEPPIELLQDAIARGLRSSGAFRAVSTLRSDAGLEYCINGQLYAFREVSENGGVLARLNYEVELMDLKRGRVVWRHTYNHDEPTPGKTVADLAAAMDKNVHASVQEIQDGIIQTLANYQRK